MPWLGGAEDEEEPRVEGYSSDQLSFCAWVDSPQLFSGYVLERGVDVGNGTEGSEAPDFRSMGGQ